MTYSIQRPSNSETSPRNSSNEFCHFRGFQNSANCENDPAWSFNQSSDKVADEFPNLWKNHILFAPSARSSDEYCAFGLVRPRSSVMVLVLLNWLALVQD